MVEISNIPSPLVHLNSVDEWANIWYSAAELHTFRSEARNWCRKLLLDDDFQKQRLRKTPALARDGITRGLEPRCCIERQRRKYISIRDTVHTAWKLRHEETIENKNTTNYTFHHDAEKIAQRAKIINAWATKLAIEEAARDFYRAYSNDEEEDNEPEIQLLKRKTNNHVGKKRTSSVTQERNVRPRIMAIHV